MPASMSRATIRTLWLEQQAGGRISIAEGLQEMPNWAKEERGPRSFVPSACGANAAPGREEHGPRGAGGVSDDLPSAASSAVAPRGAQCSCDGAAAVIEEVVHDEPPAVVDPTEAALLVQQQWAGFIERLVECGAFEVAFGANDGGGLASLQDQVHWLCLNRRPKEALEAIAGGAALRACRSALEAEGLQWQLIGGAMVFVHPHQYRSVVYALLKRGFSLRRSDIVIARSLEHLLEESLAKSNIGNGAWVCERRLVDHEDDDEVLATTVPLLEVDWSGLEVTRTFLCSAPRLRRPQSVAQSTTAARPRAGRNPRLLVAP